MTIRKNQNSNLDTCKDKVELQYYCPDFISKNMSKELIESTTFDVAELSGSKNINIHIRAYVDFFGGYADHGRYVCNRLHNTGEFNVKLTPIKSLVDIDPFTHQKMNFFVNNPAFKIDNSIFLTIAGPGWAQEKFISKDRYSIIWTMIESKECPEIFKDWFNNVDEIWCPTSVDVERFSSLGTQIENKLIYMPLGYNEDLYDWEKNYKRLDISSIKEKFVFGVVGSWNKRKNIKKIIRAFCKAFKGRTDVCLLLVTKYGTRPYDGIKDGEKVKKDDSKFWDIKYEFNRYTSDLTDLPQICLIDIPLQENIMPHIYKTIDCLVGFSLGESTWLPGLQAMAMRVPVIQLHSPSNGFADYMNDSNSFLCYENIDISADDELVLGTSDYYKDMTFFDGNEEELMQKMLIVESNHGSDGIASIIARAGNYVENNWTESLSIEKVSRRLQEIKEMQNSGKL